MFQTPTPTPVPGQAGINSTTLATFGVATAAIFAVTVVFRKVFKINHPGVALATALAISFALAARQNELRDLIGWLVAVLNAALLFCSGVGLNETAAELGQPTPAGQQAQQGSPSTEGRTSQPALKSVFRR